MIDKAEINQLPFPFHSNKKIKEVLILGNYGGGNIGDEAMLDVLVELLIDNLYEPKIVIPSRFTSSLQQIHTQSAFTVIPMVNSIKKILTADLLIIGGGTIFHSKSGFAIYLLAMLTVMRKLIFRKKYYYYGIGVSKIGSKFLKALMKMTFKLSECIYLRDSMSYTYVINNFAPKSVFLMTDLAIFLKKSISLPESIQEILKSRRSGPVIGFSLCSTYTEYDSKLIPSIAEFIRHLCEMHDATVLMLTFYPAFGNKDPNIRSDEQVNLSVLNLLPINIRPQVHLLPYINPSSTLRIISNIDVIVSMRYHGLVFAHKENKPIIAIASDDKHRSFIKDFGGELLELHEVSLSELAAKWKKLYSKAGTINKKF